MGIFQKAAGESCTEGRKTSRLPLAALCAISAVMVAVFALLIPVTQRKDISADRQKASGYESLEISHIPAGTVLPESPVTEEKESSTGCDEVKEPEEDSLEESPEPDSEQDATASDPDQ